MITALVTTNGRDDYLRESIATFENLSGSITRRVIHDDTHNETHTQNLREIYEPQGWEVIESSYNAGFAGSVKSARTWLSVSDKNPYIFWTEDDFLYTTPTDLNALVDVVSAQPYLVQMTLKRQPWNEEEKAVGGYVEQRPDTYTEMSDERHTWLEHRNFFSTNPSVIPRWFVVNTEWPLTAHSEGLYSHALFSQFPTAKSGVWGGKNSPPYVTHIGENRTGTNY